MPTAARALAAAGRLGGAVLSSFHPFAVRRAALAEPGLACGALVEDGGGWEWRLGLGLAFARDTVHPPWTLVTPSRVAGWKRGGRRVLVWTVDDPEVAARCLDAGVDGLITNVPDRIRPVCERFGR